MKKRILSLVLACLMLLLYCQPVPAAETETSEYAQRTESLPTAEKLEIGPSLRVAAGEQVILSGQASQTAAENVTYRYIYYDGTAWNEIASSDTVEPVVWQPAGVGVYLVAFQVLADGTETNAFQTLQVENGYFYLNGIQTRTDSAGAVEIFPQYETNRNTENISFSYLLYDLSEQTWYTIQENAGDSCVWTPSKAGDYWIHVIAKTADGTEISHTIGYRVSGAAVNGIQIIGGSSQIWDTTVTLSGNVSNPWNQHLTYEYLAYDGAYWSSIDKSTELKEVQYRAPGPGSYLLCFQVYDENNSLIGQSFASYTALESQLQISGAEVSLSETGETVMIRPRYTTNRTDSVSFTYMIYDLQSSIWYTIQENTGEQGEWKLWAPGNYWIHIVGKASDGTEAAYTMGYVVENTTEVTGIQIKTEENGDWNAPAVLTGSVRNPLNRKLTYEYLAYDGQYWKSLSKSGKLDSVSFVPDAPGDYLLCFQVYDESGKLIGQKFTGYTAKAPALRLGTIETTAVTERKIQLDLKGTVTDDPKAEYRWMYYDLASQTWGLIRDWSGKTNAVWYPEKSGTYWIHAEGRTSAGETSSVTIGYEVIDLYVNLTDLQVYTPDYRTYYIKQNVDSNDSHLQYKYQIYDLRTLQWFTLPEGHNTYWQPQVSGSYWIHAAITGSDGREYTNTIGYVVQGYRISSLDVTGNLEAGQKVQLSLKGTAYLNEEYTFSYFQWNGTGWHLLTRKNSSDPADWTPPVRGDYALLCQVTNQYGVLVDQIDIHIYPQDFMKNGWYYENGYKLYYIDGEKQLDLEGILPRQDMYAAKVNRQTGTVTIFAADGSNGYIIPVKRFACSTGAASTPTPTGSFSTADRQRWHQNTSGQYGQYATRITGNIWFLSVEGNGMSSFNVQPEKYNQLGSPNSTGNVCLSVADAKWIYENCPSGMQVTVYDSSDPGPLGRGTVVTIDDANQNWDPTDSNAIYAAAFDSQAKEVMHQIIYAVETGGQIYGNADYGNFTEAYTNSDKETAITIGAGAWFATEARNLLVRIRQADPAMFQALDTANIGEDLSSADWSTYGTDGKGNITIRKGSAKAVCIQNIISSETGKRIQDQLVDEQMERYVGYAKELGVSDLKAQMFCANIEHLGGYSAMEWVVEICKEDNRPLTMDNLYRSMRAHNSNPNGVGSDKYSQRHKKVMQWINQYIVSK